MEQTQLELGNFKLLQAIRRSQEARNKEARKSFFRFVKFNFFGEKNGPNRSTKLSE